MKDSNFEVITVDCDSKGAAAGQPFIDAANPRHPSLIDSEFVVAERYNTKNVPAAFWIDEAGRIVRANDPIYIQRRNRETGESTINERYLEGLRDWIARGPASAWATEPAETSRRIGDAGGAHAQSLAHFRLGALLDAAGKHEASVQQFKRAQELRPENWNLKRQAWNLGDIEGDYATSMQAEREKNPNYPPLEMPE